MEALEVVHSSSTIGRVAAASSSSSSGNIETSTMENMSAINSNPTATRTSSHTPPVYIPAPTLSSDQALTSDHSMLIKPIRLKDSTIRTIVDCVRNGTPEVRDLLISECEMIFECRMCRSLHRSLANFIAHKRVFCKEHCCESMPLFEHADDEMVVVQPTEYPATASTTTAMAPGTPSSSNNYSPNEDGYDMAEDNGVNEILISPQRIYRPLAKKPGRKKTPVKISSNVSDNQTVGKPPPVREFFDGVLKHLRESRMRRAAAKTITLSAIEGNSNAVFQAENQIQLQDNQMPKLEPPIHDAVEGRYSVETVKTDISIDVCDAIARASNLPSPVPDSPESTSSSSMPILDAFSTPPFFPQPIPSLTPSLMVIEAGSMQQASESRRMKSILTSVSSSALDARKGKPTTASSRSHERVPGTITRVPCIKCRTLFTSVKTLIVHLKSVHSKNRIYFQCIFCMNKFSNSWAVGRHIMRAHRRSKAQTIKMKKRIFQKAFQNVLDDVNTSDEDECNKIDLKSMIRPKVESSPKANVSTNKSLAIKDLDSQTSTKVSSGLNSRTRTLRNKRALHHCGNCKMTFVQLRSLALHEKSCGGSNGRLIKKSAAALIAAGAAKMMKKKRSIDDVNNGESQPPTKKAIKNKKRAAENGADDRGSDVVKKCGRGCPVSLIRSTTHPPSSVSLTQIRSLECNNCGLRFSNLSNCRRHVAKHIGLNRYKCKYCDYMSYHRYNVCYHMQGTHSREVAGKTDLAIKNSLIIVGPPPPPEKAPRTFSASESSSTTSSPESAPVATAAGSKPTISMSTAKRSSIVKDKAQSFLSIREKLTPRKRVHKESQVNSEQTETPKGTLTRKQKKISSKKSNDKKPVEVGTDALYEPPPTFRSKPVTKFNISTRRNPRVFDTTPYRRADIQQSSSTKSNKTATKKRTTTLDTRSNCVGEKNLKTRRSAGNSFTGHIQTRQLNGISKGVDKTETAKTDDERMSISIKLPSQL